MTSEQLVILLAILGITWLRGQEKDNANYKLKSLIIY
jgi:hypothetical protein